MIFETSQVDTLPYGSHMVVRESMQVSIGWQNLTLCVEGQRLEEWWPRDAVRLGAPIDFAVRGHCTDGKADHFRTASFVCM